MVRGDRSSVTWPHFRKTISHRWYVDRRDRSVGFLNRDEVSLLYSNARLFAGERGLEIGTWRGWSTCHLARAGILLDVIDPVLHDEEWKQEIATCLALAGAASRVNLHAGSSPTTVEELGTAQARWSFAFIDGDHEGDAPKRDVLACLPHMTETAVIMLHDVIAPAVAEAMAELRAAGWQTLIYQTSQIMGIGWRGDARPVMHQADPSQKWDLPPHLRSFAISGETSKARADRFGEVLSAVSDCLQNSVAHSEIGTRSLWSLLGWPLTSAHYGLGATLPDCATPSQRQSE
jgi:predicted O-methyltransferase YrrM